MNFHLAELEGLTPLLEVNFWKGLLENPQSLFTIDSLQLGGVVCVVAIFLTYTLAIINNNYSMVDRIWSIIPWVYVWIYVLREELTKRSLVLLVLPTLWGIRLTYNYARKGGYKKGEEDYRWVIVRKIYGPVVFQIMNATFIAPFQNILLFILTAPAYLIVKHSNSNNLNLNDFISIFLFLFLLLIETIADQQQWNFQQEKKKFQEKNQGKIYKTGFITSGLFKYSRHPNFFAEQLIWWVYYYWAASLTGLWFNWTIFGTLSLTLLFQKSNKLTEDISCSKYPLYNTYIQNTSRFLPLPSNQDWLKKQN